MQEIFSCVMMFIQGMLP